uniref:Selectin P ligand n=1 Tax=Microcebus murinus TaxID=30608 RepID=A0A8C5Y0G0_MICMU
MVLSSRSPRDGRDQAGVTGPLPLFARDQGVSGGAMPPQLLLLLTLLGPGSSFPPGDSWADGDRKAPGPLLARGRRHVPGEDMEDYDYIGEGTDPPETLESITSPGSPEPATVEAATKDTAGLDTGGKATGNLSTELGALSMGPATMEVQTTQPAATEALTTGPPATEALTTGPPATEALTMGPPATEALTMGPPTTEALTTGPPATEALTTGPPATEALTMGPPATEALTMGPPATEALTTGPPATEALTTGPPATEALTMGPPATEALTMGLTAMEALSTETPPSVALSMELATVKDIPGAASNLSTSPPGIFVAPTSTGPPDHIPVKQCLLAILILALVATVFLVCTVVLAVRLSRKNHTYPVRNYSPTEMVCISSLLPDGAEGPPATANGGLPKARSQGLTPEPGEDHEGDDLTLHSFLP